jgi:NADH-ubiquinone oxidoreductase chain 2
VGPLFLLIENIYRPFVIIVAASINALVGGLGGLAQSEIRPLLAFSSIGHIGWLLYSINFSHLLTFVYFLSYLIHLIVLIFLFSKINAFSATDISSTYPASILTKFIIPLILISLGGLPPLLGFIPKLLVINLATGTFIAPLILILGRYINIYYYLNLLWGSYISNFETLSPSTRNMFIPNALTFILLAIPLIILYGLNIHL